MGNPLNRVPGVEFIAGRPCTLWGVKYAPGDIIPNDVLTNTHIEALIRCRKVIAVVERKEDVPRAWWNDIKVREKALAKLKVEDRRVKPEPKAEEKAEQAAEPQKKAEPKKRAAKKLP